MREPLQPEPEPQGSVEPLQISSSEVTKTPIDPILVQRKESAFDGARKQQSSGFLISQGEFAKLSMFELGGKRKEQKVN